MAENSKIEWTDATWNPVLGCDKISPGCKNCYAIRTAWRLQHNPNPKVAKAFEGLTVLQSGKPNWTGRVNFVEERLEEPLKWKKPRRIFVNSQSDLFHENVDDSTIALIFAVMLVAPEHTFQILTKRPKRMLDWLTKNNPADCYTEGQWEDSIRRANHGSELARRLRIADYIGKMAPSWAGASHIWLGVSVENQQYADERIPLLLQTPAAVRWISAEPLLGEVCIERVPRREKYYEGTEPLFWYPLKEGINWVVAGGESGPNARPMHPDWARSLRDQCKAAGVPFFFKQWGEWANGSDCRKEELCLYRDGRSCDFTQEEIVAEERRSGIEHRLSGGTVMAKLGKKAAGRLLDGKEYNEYPEAHAH